MTPLGWLTRSLADVPRGDQWLSRRERAASPQLATEKRRSDWRLGRLAAKAAVGSWLGVEPTRVEVLAAADGAPHAHLDGEPSGVALSISHRAGRALAVVAAAPAALGCDLELVEPRSEAFVREWLAQPERQLLASVPEGRRSLAANLMWAAKEAAAKARREGLRLDVRGAAARPLGLAESTPEWRPLELRWPGDGRIAGWWCEEPGWVMTVVADPPPRPPCELQHDLPAGGPLLRTRLGV
jgi:4'-phosphopantetheinyl transferase